VYRDEFDVFLRNQTTQTAEKAQKKWRSRATKKPEHQDDEDTPTESTPPCDTSSGRSNTGSPGDLALAFPQAMSLGPSLHDLAHQRFLFDFVVPDNSSKFMEGFQTFIPGFYNLTSPGSCFGTALSAAALANYGGRCKSTEAQGLAVEQYAKALGLLNQSLRNPKESRKQETLAAVVLLGVYEVCLGFTP
jgi:hypothetical protein